MYYLVLASAITENTFKEIRQSVLIPVTLCLSLEVSVSKVFQLG